jgi:nucleotide-binding universal stress UspA family protein
LLLVPRPQDAPSKALICVAGGEPGKDDVLFAGRLMRHLSAEAVLLSILQTSNVDEDTRLRVERFLEGGVRSLSLLGVPASSSLRTGSIPEEILAEAQNGGFDLVILGSPLVNSSGKASLSGIIDQTLSLLQDVATLIVRSHYVV